MGDAATRDVNPSSALRGQRPTVVLALGYGSREEVFARNAKELDLEAKDRQRLLLLATPVTNRELQLRRADGTSLWC